MNYSDATDQLLEFRWKMAPSEEQQQDFNHLVQAWVTVGMFGAYTGRIHYLGEISHKNEITTCNVDLGSADIQRALEELENLIKGFNPAAAQVPGWTHVSLVSDQAIKLREY